MAGPIQAARVMDQRPSAGPGARNRKRYSGPMITVSPLSNWMLMIVMAKPTHVTMVSAVPFCIGDAWVATIVENNGESATTVIPQQRRKTTNNTGPA